MSTNKQLCHYAALRFAVLAPDCRGQEENSIDKNNICVSRDGKVGALALTCTGLYEGLRYFFRWRDPLHEREADFYEKKHLVYPKYGHERNNFSENEYLKFLLQ